MAYPGSASAEVELSDTKSWRSMPQETSGNAPAALSSPLRTETIASAGNQADILSSLPPPPPFDLRVTNLTVGVPPPSHYLPLPIPIPIPAFLRKKTPDDTRPKAILTDVSAECHAGEMLAM